MLHTIPTELQDVIMSNLNVKDRANTRVALNRKIANFANEKNECHLGLMLKQIKNGKITKATKQMKNFVKSLKHNPDYKTTIEDMNKILPTINEEVELQSLSYSEMTPEQFDRASSQHKLKSYDIIMVSINNKPLFHHLFKNCHHRVDQADLKEYVIKYTHGSSILELIFEYTYNTYNKIELEEMMSNLIMKGDLFTAEWLDEYIKNRE